MPALVRRRARHGDERVRAVRFRFDGVEYEGREGETLAAALVRNGVLGGFRSIYRDRPRGVYTADEQEPNALVQIGAEPMMRATLVELEDGLEAVPLAGKGRLVAGPARRLDASHAHCDVLVVGGGPIGCRRGSGRDRTGDPARRRADSRARRGPGAGADHRRGPLRGQLRGRRRAWTAPLAHPRQTDRARDRSARTARDLRGQRSPRRDARRRRVEVRGGRSARRLGWLEPARAPLEPGRRTAALGRSHRRAGARR